MQTGTPAIRPVEPGDRERLQAIRAEAFSSVFASFGRMLGSELAPAVLAQAEAEQRALLDRLLAPDATAVVLVASTEEEAVGFVSYTLDPAAGIGEIGLNAVHPDHGGQGIGTRLYEAAVEAMRAAGMTITTVSTGGDPSHAPARRAYAKVGFGHELPSVTLYRRL